MQNAEISQRRDADEKIRQNRVRELLRYDWVIMTGTVNDVTKVVPRLPRNIGSHSVYTDGVAEVTYKLLEITQLSSKISCYKYKAEDVIQHSIKKIVLVFYHW
ncbi:hypothetical protein OESDEN_06725 [Oesophagostomum dentatum]|uniref:Uncharacterized protein n=1 Tax=Oesophagostomum dentatum TaxID=61180 RepID=A0A0B1T718_OESDE|nr:hypothetical protein OESDEN_06725 [Oesophagostomum dentatum]